MSKTPHWEMCDDDDCITCRDRRERYEAKAREHALDRAIRQSQQSDTDASLEDFA